jgi:hypothetical protein
MDRLIFKGMIFLDFLYLVCCDYYKKNEPDLFKIKGVILLETVFLLNILLLSFVLSGDVTPEHVLYKYRYHWICTTFLVILLLLYIRYFKVTNYEIVNNKSFSFSEKGRNRYYRLAVLYIIFSFCSTLVTAFYLGGRVKGWWN